MGVVVSWWRWVSGGGCGVWVRCLRIGGWCWVGRRRCGGRRWGGGWVGLRGWRGVGVPGGVGYGPQSLRDAQARRLESSPNALVDLGLRTAGQYIVNSLPPQVVLELTSGLQVAPASREQIETWRTNSVHMQL